MRKQVLSLFILFILPVIGQNIISQLKKQLPQPLGAIYLQSMMQTAKIKIDSIGINDQNKTIEIFAGLPLSYMPMREETVNSIYDSIRYYLPRQQKEYTLSVFTDQREITSLIPNYHRQTIEKDRNRNLIHNVSTPLTKNISSPFSSFTKGLDNNHIAMWQSHGWYYEQKLSRWEWQRARIFQTVEDIYTQSYVVPFLLPMLENAGANVLLPRERDYNKTEIIVDNDKNINAQSLYKETVRKEAWLNWQDSSIPGFAHTKEYYLDGENPFKMGKARQIKTITDGVEHFAEWIPAIPKKDKYGVYVSYQTFDNSTEEANYKVYHAGGETEFQVNQKMGGGTWIFLGHFTFDKDKKHRVVLSNKTRNAGEIVSADAVKIGGGMGNIARLPNPGGFEKETPRAPIKCQQKKKLL